MTNESGLEFDLVERPIKDRVTRLEQAVNQISMRLAQLQTAYIEQNGKLPNDNNSGD